MEIWKDIKGYEGKYEISNLGRVKSIAREVIHPYGGVSNRKERILRLGKSSCGYLTCSLSLNGIKKTFKTHWLVAMAFLNHIPNGYVGLVVDHIDNDKLNNKLYNLQLISQRENLSKDQKNCTSIYTGVCWSKHKKKWISKIGINNRSVHLGSFDCELKASEAYQKALKDLNN